jgi:hypothetical protein
MMNNNIKTARFRKSSVFRMIVYAVIFITLVSGYSFAGTLLPKNMVIKDKFVPGKGSPIGKVYSVNETVVLIHSDELFGYKANNDLPVFERDTVITQKKGRIEIVLSDGSKLILAPETRLELTKSIYDPNAKTRSSFINMIAGKARFIVTKLSNFNSSDFRVKTKTAVAGVRGSDFIIAAKPGFTEVSALAKTSLEVANVLWPDKIAILSDYERTTVRQDALPTPVERIPADEINRIQNEMGGAIGSDISGVIINKFSGSNLTNIAIGKGSEANLGTVKIEGSKIKGAIVNEGSASNVTNVAVGDNASANTSSIVIK